MRIKVLAIIIILMFINAGTMLWCDISYEEFSYQLGILIDSMKNSLGEDAMPSGTDLFFPKFRRINSHNGKIVLNLKWVHRALNAIKNEKSLKKRKIFMKIFINNLAGLRKDLKKSMFKDDPSYKEMLEALDRVDKNIAKLPSQINSSMEGKYSNGSNYSQKIDGDVVAFKVQNTGNNSSRFSPTNKHSRSGSRGTYNNSSSTNNSSSRSTGTNNSSSFSNNTTSSSGTSSGNSPSTNGSSNVSGTTGKISGRSGAVQTSVQQTNSQTGSSRRSSTNNTSYNRNSNNKRKTQTRNVRPKRKKVPRKPKKRTEPKRPKPKKKKKNSSGFFKVLLKILYWLIVIMLVLFAIGLILFLIKTISENMKPDDLEISVEMSKLPEEKAPPDTLYEKAIKAAAAGDYEKGIRLLTIASLIILDEKRLVGFDNSRTNGEYLISLVKKRGIHTLFNKPLRLFDRLVYGENESGKEEFEVFRMMYKKLVDMKVVENVGG
ncbi:hypothetical protein KAJ27_22915 [bacterium]|nr:hypothetical protein [bacterium]